MVKQVRSIEECVTDAASVEVLRRAQEECIDTCFSRVDAQSVQCKFGNEGVCCRICYMGPCRITTKSPYGICGADAATIVARNFLREVVGGTAAHSDHGRHLVLRLKKVARGNGRGYQVKDERALRYTARLYGIEETDRGKEEVALDLADLFLKEFTSQEENLRTTTLAPLKQQDTWHHHHLTPLGIDLTNLYVLSLVSTVMSNLFSNVPAVMLLTRFLDPGDPYQWQALALSSTFAGNLITIGSIVTKDAAIR